ncbi:hypothetical protein EUGRSUZ_C04025 [Eucalyptus grandis]|uniref:Uncharacterized protein n=2 Tax=Eucalyptus grandis TaxID=71139 RepID=A0ACC3LLS8_EUCGR|nr:hypothetical protein EUGRSUZ_C04025 [Eucalyptus grandis]
MGHVGKEIMQFVSSLSPESLVVINGLFTVPARSGMLPTALEIRVRKIFCINGRFPSIPYILNEDTIQSNQMGTS